MSENIQDRVTRLEANLDRFVDVIFQGHRDHQVQLESQQAQINAVTQLVRQVAESQIVLMNTQNEMLTRFDQMQSEIRGLRTETQRMLEALLERDSPEDEPNN